jgi:hypothetical protein
VVVWVKEVVVVAVGVVVGLVEVDLVVFGLVVVVDVIFPVFLFLNSSSAGFTLSLYTVLLRAASSDSFCKCSKHLCIGFHFFCTTYC